MFPQELRRAAELVPAHVEMGLADLLAHGLVTCDSFAAVRQMITPPSKRKHALRPVGRWSCFRRAESVTTKPEASVELVARQLLRRTGVVFRKTWERERLAVPWSALVRTYRRMELRGEIRGGRFVERFAGEQFALPEAVELMRKLRREGVREPVTVSATDPLNFQGLLTPEPRGAAAARQLLPMT
jgi:ATP-dependent Lhr-like helicase